MVGTHRPKESKLLETRCQYSKIVIPGDPGYASIAAAYTGTVAVKLGFAITEVEDIKRCTERVVAWTIDYSLSENEKASVEISCEVIPEGFKITVNDRGVPFEPSMLRVAETKDLASLFRIEGRMDEIGFNNLGPGGKQIILLKYTQQGLITDLYSACALEFDATEPEPVRPRDKDFVVRPMMPDEAVEVSKCVYKGYGYTYPHDHIYYPAKLAELNRNNRMFSAVAVNGQGGVVGHCALLYENADNGIAEMGLGVVRPEYRAMGCFSKLTAFLIEKAQADHLKGLFVRAVAAHKYSQQAAARFALKETALLLAYIPPNVDFKRLAKRRSQRVTAFLCFRYLLPPSPPVIHPPERHGNMIIGLYHHLGIKPVVKSPARRATVSAAESRIHVKVVHSMGFASIVVENSGKNIVGQISQSVTELGRNKIEVVNLHLDLSDPRTGAVSEEMEKSGFFFSGILPGGMPNGSDALIYQYLNNVFVDYTAVQAHSDMAQRLLAYVGGRHP